MAHLQRISNEFLQVTFQKQLWNPEDNGGIDLKGATKNSCRSKILNLIELCFQHPG